MPNNPNWVILDKCGKESLINHRNLTENLDFSQSNIENQIYLLTGCGSKSQIFTYSDKY